MKTGTVVRFDGIKGYGFIAPDAGGEDVFLHASILDEELKEVLRGGMRVEFEAVPGNQGTKAMTVNLLGAATRTPPPLEPEASAKAEAGAASRQHEERADDEMCDVLPTAEFAQKITDVLIEAAPSMTGGQILQARKQLVAFAQRHGWVEG
ncbi:putative cold-shock DNA-binding protein [Saccharopolyspora erythraea NRRL 2338]|uniref:DNA-binding protein n=2 Tax=Saccharopolyspora erythraea TaxID=1836 RepID=A4FKV9_SACEN|nr:cold shock domain-containing protein [Saccharopolyspora erythraea]EQD85671.1 DNA-binding protein [Saccharopolyspora erythraea D]PFG98324.1 putative cold-shock DNA-binding protein [Saccharopolyspora erythraea NRRL 2338]QRK88404.1 cold shock domain-containing protein [Saccharopolyspora erythraea]CAM04684.1 putative DNA-binding protein [Saccharopolyspora erythraea NRRL 2338]